MRSLTIATSVLVAAILLCGVSLAQERSNDDAGQSMTGDHQFAPRDVGDATGAPPQYRASSGLELMSSAERANAIIQIDAAGCDDAVILTALRTIDALWNQYDFDKAIDRLRQLETDHPNLQLEVLNIWRVPVSSVDQPRFGGDVRIGGRDSVNASDLDIHYASGALFTSLVVLGDGYQSRVAMYFSSNGGATWSETFYAAYSTYTVRSHNIAVVDDHCYLTWVVHDTLVSVCQCKIADGMLERFSSGNLIENVFSVSPPAYVSEVNLISNQDFGSTSYHRLYLWALTSTNALRLFWDDEGAVSWTEVATGITDAATGLDAAVNEDYSSYFMFVSYDNVNDSMCIRGTNGSTFPLLLKRSAGSASASLTSIGAYCDTVHCFYECVGALLQCRYQVSYNGGTTWAWGVVDDTSAISELPAITAREGGGVGLTYRYYSSPREGRFTWRRYGGWPWPTPQRFSDYQPSTMPHSIEYLGSGIYGVVYYSWTSPYVRAAYFDRGSGCCVGTMGNIDGSGDGLVTMGDLTVLIDNLFITLTPLACPPGANLDESADGLITMGDLTILIDHLFITLTPLPDCP